jgi:hypothetical protein
VTEHTCIHVYVVLHACMYTYKANSRMYSYSLSQMSQCSETTPKSMVLMVGCVTKAIYSCKSEQKHEHLQEYCDKSVCVCTFKSRL